MLESLSKFLLLSGSLLLAASIWKNSELPTASTADPVLLQEPLQLATANRPFSVSAEGIRYEVKPLYLYTLHGLVVSRHDTSSWWDYLHREWNDHLNVADLCVIWGNNLKSEAYREMSFSSGQFTCNFKASSSEVFRKFDLTAISNNHMLTNNPAVAQALRNVKIGDQVRFSGYLAEYSHKHDGGFQRGTSTVRTDTGNGACETVWLEDFEVIRRNSGPWHWLIRTAWVLLGLGVVMWFAVPFRARH
jgi:hypothetical protein